MRYFNSLRNKSFGRAIRANGARLLIMFLALTLLGAAAIAVSIGGNGQDIPEGDNGDPPAGFADDYVDNYEHDDVFYGDNGIGIAPIANFTVIFDPNDEDKTDPSYFEIRLTLNFGNVGAENMPDPPAWPGRHFMAWTRSRDGSGTATDNIFGELFDGNSQITAGQNPFTVYAQWGHAISFHCGYTTLDIPNEPNPNANNQYGPRVVRVGKSFADSNALVWTAPQVWPSDLPQRFSADTNRRYFFAGWYTKDDGGNYDQRFDAHTPVTEDVRLYARWLSRRLVFNPRNGTAPEAFIYRELFGTHTGAVSIGDVANIPPAPTHPDGLHFMRWTRTEAGLGSSSVASVIEPLTATATFTITQSNPTIPGMVFAQWGHRVSFDGNGIALNMPETPNLNNANDYNPRIVAAGQSFWWTRARTWGTPVSISINQIVWPSNPRRTGYVFGGWFSRDANGNYDQNFTDGTPINEDVTLYARWIPSAEYEGRTVVFNPQNGTPDSDFAHVLTLPAGNIGADNWPAPDPTFAGRHFMAWTRTQDGGGSALGNSAGVLFNANSSIAAAESPFTVFAQWGHLVSFDLNGFTGTTPASRVYVAGRSANASNALVWTDNIAWPADPTTFDRAFLGWYTRGQNEEYDRRFDADTPIDGDTVLYARWTLRHVFFDPNDGVTQPENFEWRPLSDAANAAIQDGMPPNPEHPSGLHFMAWTRTLAGLGTATVLNARELVNATTTFPLAAGTPTVFAQWGHWVSFDGNGHQLADGTTAAGYDPRLVLSGTSFAETNSRTWTPSTIWPNNPVRRGFNFVGWFEDGGGDVQFDGSTPVTRDVRLYARWEPLRVYFDPNDGLTLPAHFAMREMLWSGVVGEENIPIPPPLPDGRQFMRWLRPPSRYGSAGAEGFFAYTPFTGTSWIHAIESPLVVTARYGWQISFHCDISTLPPGTTEQGFSPRLVYAGMSLAQTNDLSWTINTPWPQLASTSTMSFLGWYPRDANGDYGQRVNADTIITGETELFARWVPRGVTFDPNNGITQPADFEWRPLSTAANATIQGGMPPDPTIPPSEGLHFIAWTRTLAGLGTATAFNTRELVGVTTTFPLAAPTPVTVFGQWGHRVQFHGNGVTLPGGLVADGYEPRFVLPGTTFAETNTRAWLTTLWPNDPATLGHIFLGWYTKDAVGNYEGPFIFDPSMVFTGNLDLYARWETAEVIFDLQDGLTPPSAFETRSLLPNATVGAANMPDTPLRNGYRFMSWTRTADGIAVPPWTNNTHSATGVMFSGASTVSMEHSPLSVFAQWGHQLTFQANGGSLGANSAARVIRTGKPSLQDYSLPGQTLLPWPNNPTRSQHTFMGWYTRDEHGNYAQRVDVNTPITSDIINAGSALGDITLFARWTPTIEMFVVFNPNDDGATDSADFITRQTNSIGSISTASWPANPTWGDRVFLGWTRTQDGTGAGTGPSSGIRFVPHANNTNTSTITASESPFSVFAQWAHHLSFDGNGTSLPGGTGASGFAPRNISANRNIAEHNALSWTTNLTWPNNPTRGGWGFLGWYTRDEHGDYAHRVDASRPITSELFDADSAGSVTLFARWNRLEVIFNPNGGTNATGVDRTFMGANNTLGSLPQPPTRPGFGFIAWTRTQSGDVIDPWTNQTAAQNAARGIHFGATSTIPNDQSPFTIYAQWSHQLGFLGNGVYLPSGTYGIRNIAVGRSMEEHNALAWTSNVFLPPNPTRTGYAFTGWAIIEDGEIVGWFDQNTALKENTVLVAQWEAVLPPPLPPIMTVTFDMQDGFLGPSTIGPGVQEAIREAFQGRSVNVSSNSGHPAATRLNVGRAWPRSAPQVLRDYPVPMTVQNWWTERYGWDGDGVWWSPAGVDAAANAGSSSGTVSAGQAQLGRGWANTPVYEDITVYPNWVFRVRFLPNGGSNATGARYRDVPARYCDEFGGYPGETIRNEGRFPSGAISRDFPPDPSRSSHVFVGWWSHPIPPSVPLGQEAAHGFGDAYQFTLDHLVTQDRDVHARWIPLLPVPPESLEFIPLHFDLNDGGSWWGALPPGGATANRTVQVLANSTLGNSGMPQFPIANEGYIFMGWFNTPHGPACTLTPPDLSADRFLPASTIITEERTVYAHWEPLVILTVDSNGGNPVENRYRMMAQGRNFAEMRSIWGGTGSTGGNLSNVSGNARPPGWPEYTSFTNPNVTSNIGSSLLFTTSRPGFQRLPAAQFWNTRADRSGASFNDSFRVWEPMTIYAQWRLVIIFDNNRSFFAGTGIGSNTTLSHLIDPGQTMRSSNISFPTGHNWTRGFSDGVIIDWNTARDGSGESFTLDTVVNGPTTVFAVWSAYVVFHPNQALTAPNGPGWDLIPPEHRERRFSTWGHLSNSFSPLDPSITGLPPDDVPLDWPGHIFLGWNLNASPTNPLPGSLPDTDVDNTTIFFTPTRIYAIWEGEIVFHPNGGSMTVPGEGGLPTPVPSFPVRRELGALFGVGTVPENLEREGWRPATRPGHPGEYLWSDGDQFGLINRNPAAFYPHIRVDFGRTFWAQWIVDLHFIAPGGTVNGLPGVTYTIPESGTLANAIGTNLAANAVNSDIPPNLDALAPHRPGYAFTHWEVQVWDSDAGEYVWIEFEEDMRIEDVSHRFRRDAAGRIVVEARFEPTYILFEFFKTDTAVYGHDNPAFDLEDVTFLDGALFRLYRWNDEIGEDGDWALIAEAESECDLTTLGRVALPPLTTRGPYRLREQRAPQDFVAPPAASYWLIRFCPDESSVEAVDEFGGTPPFVEIDGVWYVGNQRGIPFAFHKTDQRLYSRLAEEPSTWGNVANYLLPGAQFRMFRFHLPNSHPDMPALGTGAEYLVAFYDDGSLSAASALLWAEVELSSAGSTGLISAPISYIIHPLYTYHLVEIQAPYGFETPWGQWRIAHNESRHPDPAGQFDLAWIGDPMIPAFSFIPATDLNGLPGSYWYVGNRQPLEIPLTGALSAGHLFTIGGLLTLGLALGGGTVYAKHAKLGPWKEDDAFAACMQTLGYSCANCKHSFKVSSERAACSRYGVVPLDSVCGKFCRRG